MIDYKLTALNPFAGITKMPEGLTRDDVTVLIDWSPPAGYHWSAARWPIWPIEWSPPAFASLAADLSADPTSTFMLEPAGGSDASD
jgi:hypothetical protein